MHFSPNFQLLPSTAAPPLPCCMSPCLRSLCFRHLFRTFSHFSCPVRQFFFLVGLSPVAPRMCLLVVFSLLQEKQIFYFPVFFPPPHYFTMAHHWLFTFSPWGSDLLIVLSFLKLSSGCVFLGKSFVSEDAPPIPFILFILSKNSFSLLFRNCFFMLFF